MEATVNGLDLRTARLVDMVERIERAYEAADRLPADLESLSEARKEAGSLLQEVAASHERVSEIRTNGERIESVLKDSANEADDILEKCKTTYLAATSVGLAAAFGRRSQRLANSMLYWIGGLVVALIAGILLGIYRLSAIASAFNSDQTPVLEVVLNILLLILSVGAPVWFAWLSTKQIGQRFRLSEDYGYKASIAQSYEGLRREAARFDKDMETRLLVSVLAHLDELPLRLIKEQDYDSSWRDLVGTVFSVVAPTNARTKESEERDEPTGDSQR